MIGAYASYVNGFLSMIDRARQQLFQPDRASLQLLSNDKFSILVDRSGKPMGKFFFEELLNLNHNLVVCKRLFASICINLPVYSISLHQQIV